VKVLVDTTIWSLALRRRPESLSPIERSLVGAWRGFIRRAQVAIIGPIRQEILSGVRTQAQFDLLRMQLAAFTNTAIEEEDYETAAEFFNTCRTNGIVGTPIDMLICAVAHRTASPIFTTDADFTRYTVHVPVRLHRPPPDE
jgi:predicted nucleic acid-binding protein